ncbi:conserved protein, unknown function [Hepatocystis sp. ex Piliocolobus tephrosceles]|nr:conserved protein, unknown function [Hepatocystis sp. ex Piliocolobus tephrosceles]
MKKTNRQEEKKLLIYDKSNKIGCIYFIGMNSNFYRGKMILKKNIVSDKIVRYTNLSDNLMLIMNGDYNIKQTAILIKGITVFLHRQLEILLSDFYAMYKKCLYSNFDDNTNDKIGGILKKYKTHKKLKTNKNLLCLKDVSNRNNTTTDIFMKNNNNYLTINKNVANINDILLRDYNNDEQNHDYNFMHVSVNNDDNFMYQDILTHSSIEYSKLNNFYTLNNDTLAYNLNTKNNSIQMKTEDCSSNTMINFNLLNNKKGTINIDNNNFLNNSLCDSKHMEDTKKFSFSLINNNSLLMHNTVLNNKLNNNIGNDPTNASTINNDNKINKKNKNKRNLCEIDQVVTLNYNIWQIDTTIKKRKKNNNLFYDYLEGIEHFQYYINDTNQKNSPKKRNSNNSNQNESDFNLYKLKNDNTLDNRTEIYNMFNQRMVEHEKCQIQENGHNFIQTKSTPSTISESKLPKTNETNFEQLRGTSFNENYFFKMEIENYSKKGKYTDYSSNQFFMNSEDDIDYNFDNISSNERNKNIERKLGQSNLKTQNQHTKNVNNSNGDINHQIDQCSSLFSDNLNNSLSVPSSKIAAKRSTTSSLNTYDEELAKLKNYLYKIKEQNPKTIEFERIFPKEKISDKNIASIFYNLLVLAGNGEVELTQTYPDNTIFIEVY